MGFFFNRPKAEEPYVRARREKIEAIRRSASIKLEHYLAAPFTARCAKLLREKVEAGHILQREGESLRVDNAGKGISNGLSGYPSLINFNEHGYNNLLPGEQRDGFIFAVCQLMGSDYAIDYKEDPYFDYLYPCIVKKRKPQQLKDI